MKREVIDFLLSIGYWRVAYSGKSKTLFIHHDSYEDRCKIADALNSRFGAHEFSIEFQRPRWN